jgi:hypothetical protein
MRKSSVALISLLITVLILVFLSGGIVWGHTPVLQPAHGLFPGFHNGTAPRIEGGVLTRVDPDRKAVWIRPREGDEKMYLYNDQTRIIGEPEVVQCFGSSMETFVRIRYRPANREYVAQEIEILPQRS